MQLALHFEPVEDTHVRVAGSQPLICAQAVQKSTPCGLWELSPDARAKKTSMFASFVRVSTLRQPLDKNLCALVFYDLPVWAMILYISYSALFKEYFSIQVCCITIQVNFIENKNNLQMHQYTVRACKKKKKSVS